MRVSMADRLFLDFLGGCFANRYHIDSDSYCIYHMFFFRLFFGVRSWSDNSEWYLISGTPEELRPHYRFLWMHSLIPDEDAIRWRPAQVGWRPSLLVTRSIKKLLISSKSVHHHPVEYGRSISIHRSTRDLIRSRGVGDCQAHPEIQPGLAGRDPSESRWCESRWCFGIFLVVSCLFLSLSSVDHFNPQTCMLIKA